ncbi:hypothetical protein BX600DRAFT_512390 [Xylariales sp. PMI_506]|nr:hypothetical protein BX600DRAFT_512390 [Xylariales sp. PMI_506]
MYEQWARDEGFLSPPPLRLRSFHQNILEQYDTECSEPQLVDGWVRRECDLSRFDPFAGVGTISCSNGSNRFYICWGERFDNSLLTLIPWCLISVAGSESVGDCRTDLHAHRQAIFSHLQPDLQQYHSVLIHGESPHVIEAKLEAIRFWGQVTLELDISIYLVCQTPEGQWVCLPEAESDTDSGGSGSDITMMSEDEEYEEDNFETSLTQQPWGIEISDDTLAAELLRYHENRLPPWRTARARKMIEDPSSEF